MASDELREGKHVHMAYPIIIVCSVVVLSTVEFLEMMSVGANYTLSSRTYFHVASAAASIISAKLMLVSIKVCVIFTR